MKWISSRASKKTGPGGVVTLLLSILIAVDFDANGGGGAVANAQQLAPFDPVIPVVTEDEFMPISIPPRNASSTTAARRITGLEISPLDCQRAFCAASFKAVASSSGNDDEVIAYNCDERTILAIPKVRYTVRPLSSLSQDDTNNIRVLSYPADLVYAHADQAFPNLPSSILSVPWNFTTLVNMIDVNNGTNDDNDNTIDTIPNQPTGVIIEFPPDQLETLVISGKTRVQLQDGFTSLQHIDVANGSVLQANLTTLTTTTTTTTVATTTFDNDNDNDNNRDCTDTESSGGDRCQQQQQQRLDILVTQAVANFQVNNHNTTTRRNVEIHAVAQSVSDLGIHGYATTVQASGSSLFLLDGPVLQPELSFVYSVSELQVDNCTGIQISSSGQCLESATGLVHISVCQPLTMQFQSQCLNTDTVGVNDENGNSAAAASTTNLASAIAIPAAFWIAVISLSF